MQKEINVTCTEKMIYEVEDRVVKTVYFKRGLNDEFHLVVNDEDYEKFKLAKRYKITIVEE